MANVVATLPFFDKRVIDQGNRMPFLALYQPLTDNPHNLAKISFDNQFGYGIGAEVIYKECTNPRAQVWWSQNKRNSPSADWNHILGKHLSGAADEVFTPHMRKWIDLHDDSENKLTNKSRHILVNIVLPMFEVHAFQMPVAAILHDGRSITRGELAWYIVKGLEVYVKQTCLRGRAYPDFWLQFEKLHLVSLRHISGPNWRAEIALA
ncbi:hypothetical protein VKT23_006601 [Stygiomarasmius scandens]|uniref:Uncharacterized protein n=1 Tax=Marasmiellus scandens TaxID=2682957 RepID=A0ABR1JNX2_9AGAR